MAEPIDKGLERKILCLKSILDLSQEFYSRIEKNDLSLLDSFHLKRKSLFDVMYQIDDSLKGSSISISEPIKTELRQLFSALESVDKKIIEKIRTLKDETLQSLSSAQSSKKALSGYKSREYEISKAEGAGSLNGKA